MLLFSTELLVVLWTFWIKALLFGRDSRNTEGVVRTGVGDALPSTRSGGLDDLGN